MVTGLTAKVIKTSIEEMLKTSPEKEFLFYRYDHYKVLGLPCDEKKFTDKQITEAFETLFLPCYCKSKGLPSNLTSEEIRERLQHKDTEASLQQWIEEKRNNEEAESGSVPPFGNLVISYYVLMDSAQREYYKCWLILVKCLERLEIINKEKEKLGEYELMSYDDLVRVAELYPWVVGGMVIALPVYVPARIFWLIGRWSCRAMQSAVLRHSGTGSSNDENKAAGDECSSGLEDIQDWEVVKEDDCY